MLNLVCFCVVFSAKPGMFLSVFPVLNLVCFCVFSRAGSGGSCIVKLNKLKSSFFEEKSNRLQSIEKINF